MKLTYYGTAAAEGFPALFCECDACKRAAAAGGRNIRTRSQSMIDENILIDFPADTYHHMLTHGLPLPKIEHCLVTHSHADHFYPAELLFRGPHYGHLGKERTLHLYGSAPVGRGLGFLLNNEGFMSAERIAYTELEPFREFSIGKYRIVPLKANHDKNVEPLIYVISDGKKTLLYAHDTGIRMEETWEYLERERPHFDMISLDCTEGIKPCANYHLGLPYCVEFADRLEDLGCIDKDTVRCLNHFSHNGLATYDELVPLAKEKGFLVSYDGMEVEF